MADEIDKGGTHSKADEAQITQPGKGDDVRRAKIRVAVANAVRRDNERLIRDLMGETFKGRETVSSSDVLAAIAKNRKDMIRRHETDSHAHHEFFLDLANGVADALGEFRGQVFHGGNADGTVHIRRRTVGSKGKDSTDMVSQSIADVSNSQTRFVSAKPTPYYEPSVGEARVAPGFDFIVDATDQGVVVVDPRRRLVSEPMTQEKYDLLAKRRGFFPLDPFADNAHRFGEGNPVTDEIARRTIWDAIHLLEGAKAPKSVHMNEKLEMITGLEKSLLPVIPTP